MTRQDKGKFSEKHDSKRIVDEKLKEMVLEKSKNGSISCSAAHKISSLAGVSPAEIGFVIDMLEVRLTHCVLGLFGYPDGKPVKTSPKESKPEILNSIKETASDKHLSCLQAWNIADNLKVGRLSVSREAESKGYRINECQLGAF